MPHTFKPHPKHPAVAYLIRLHADIGGRILENKKQAERLASDSKHVEAVLKMFDPDFDLHKIAPRRRVTGNPWFKRGTLYRHALDVLRTAEGPMTVAAIAKAVLASQNVTTATPAQVRNLEAGIRSSLESHAGQTVQTVGEGVPKRWRIK